MLDRKSGFKTLFSFKNSEGRSGTLKRGIVLAAIVAASALHSTAGEAAAQDRQSRGKLFNSTAMSRATERSAFTAGGLDSFRSKTIGNLSPNLASIGDVVFNKGWAENFDGIVQSHQNQVNLARGATLDESVDEDSTSIAQKVLIYESAAQASELIRNSPLEQVYLTVAKNIRRVRDYTTVQVAEREDGAYTWSQGSSKPKPLFQVKLDANLSRGIGPKIEVQDAFTFRVDMLNQRVLVELNFNY